MRRQYDLRSGGEIRSALHALLNVKVGGTMMVPTYTVPEDSVTAKQGLLYDNFIISLFFISYFHVKHGARARVCEAVRKRVEEG